jgi:uncharacterized cupin superfamily protein
MRRLNFLENEPWDEVDDEDRRRARWFGHLFDADKLGASLIELLPGAPGGPLHLHYGVEELFFVLAGTPLVRTPEGMGGARHPERPVAKATTKGTIVRFEMPSEQSDT